MPALHPALLELRTELERQGYVVVCHGDYLCLRFPLFASIRIRLSGGQLHFEPRFGPMARGTSLAFTPIAGALAVAIAVAAAPVVVTVGFGFAATLSVLADVQRLIMTEGAMTRIQLLWSSRQPPADILEAPAAGMARLPGDPAHAPGAAGITRERVPQPVQGGNPRR